jgi:hypothetical protein
LYIILGFTACQVGALFTFLARQLAGSSALAVDPELFGQVVDFLTTPDEASAAQHEERQQALLELLAAAHHLLSPQELLQKARAAKL